MSESLGTFCLGAPRGGNQGERKKKLSAKGSSGKRSGDRYYRAARNPIIATETDGVVSRMSVNAPEAGPKSQAPPRPKANTVGEPDEKPEDRMPRPFLIFDKSIQ